MKNRMRKLRTCGSVRGEGHKALVYSEEISLDHQVSSRRVSLVMSVDGRNVRVRALMWSCGAKRSPKTTSQDRSCR